MLLLAVMGSVFRIFQLVAELEECIFNVLESIWWGFTVFGAADWRHDGRVK